MLLYCANQRDIMLVLNELKILAAAVYQICEPCVDWMFTRADKQLPTLNLRTRGDCWALANTITSIVQYISVGVPADECIRGVQAHGAVYIAAVYYMLADMLHLEAIYTIPTECGGGGGDLAEYVFARASNHPDEASSCLGRALMYTYANISFKHLDAANYTRYVGAVLDIYAYTQSTDIHTDQVMPAIHTLYALQCDPATNNTNEWCSRAHKLLLLVLWHVLSVSCESELTQCEQSC